MIQNFEHHKISIQFRKIVVWYHDKLQFAQVNANATSFSENSEHYSEEKKCS